jgi:hypothetical protein
MGVSVGSILTALSAVLLSTMLIRALVLLVWRPYATRWFRAQGIHRPGYKLLVGSIPEIKRMKDAGSKSSPSCSCSNNDGQLNTTTVRQYHPPSNHTEID